ncbi:MAG: ABC transporter substrate-binding protein [Defluviitaleaceae bacterium]|nr:ABC transporter substrate-binding protein [Defluviitaleaceae bacterium]
MQKKNVLGFALLTGILFILAACGNGDSDVTVEPDPTAPTDAAIEDPNLMGLQGTIRVSWWGNEGRHDATKAVIDLFIEENPGVTILPEYGVFEGWQDRITADLLANSTSDVIQLNFNWLTLFSPFGTTFMDLEDPRITAYLDLSNWTADELNMTRTNGILQGVPVGMTARVPFLRTDIYEAAGLDVHEIHTWEELMAAGNAIQAYHGNDVFALSPLGRQSLAYMVYSYLEQLTGRPFIDDDFELNHTLEELTQGFQLIQDFLDNGVIPDLQFDSDPINAQNPLWISGAYGGVSEWDSSINAWIGNLESPDVVRIRPHFTMDGALNSGWLSRPSMVWGIAQHTEYPEVAAAFLEFMLTDQRAVEILQTDRGVPMNTAGRAHFDALNLDNLVIDAVALHQNAETVTFHPMLEFPNVREVIESRLEAIQSGESTVSEAAQFVYNNLQAEINQHLVD